MSFLKNWTISTFPFFHPFSILSLILSILLNLLIKYNWYFFHILKLKLDEYFLSSHPHFVVESTKLFTFLYHTKTFTFLRQLYLSLLKMLILFSISINHIRLVYVSAITDMEILHSCLFLDGTLTCSIHIMDSVLYKVYSIYFILSRILFLYYNFKFSLIVLIL